MITIVSGLPRSGTSMMMEMLQAGGMELLADDHRPPDARNPRGYFESRVVKRLRHEPEGIAAAEGRAVKVLCYDLRLLPPTYTYRVLFMLRDPEAVAASLAALRGGAVERLTAPPAPDGALVVPYDDMLADPLKQARRVARFLGLPLDIPAMAATVDPSLCHVGA